MSGIYIGRESRLLKRDAELPIDVTRDRLAPGERIQQDNYLRNHTVCKS